MYQAICNSYNQLLLNQSFVYVLLFVPPVLVFILSNFFLFKHTKSLLITLLALSLSFSTLVFMFFVVVIIGEADYVIASQYFPLNAAIKNTCYTDPHNLNCPHSISELIRIEPENFAKLLEGKYVAYMFDPKTEEYSLYVRHSNYQGVLFDPKLTRIADLGRDFIDLRTSCDPTSEPNINTTGIENAKNLGKIKSYIHTIWPKLAPTPF